MSLVVISPIVDLRPAISSLDLDAFSYSADHIISAAMNEAADEQIRVIKNKAEAYICDKANEFGCKLIVTIHVSPQTPYYPREIILEGSISPYCKKMLADIITSDLNIPPEDQIWKS